MKTPGSWRTRTRSDNPRIETPSAIRFRCLLQSAFFPHYNVNLLNFGSPPTRLKMCKNEYHSKSIERIQLTIAKSKLNKLLLIASRVSCWLLIDSASKSGLCLFWPPEQSGTKTPQASGNEQRRRLPTEQPTSRELGDMIVLLAA